MLSEFEVMTISQGRPWNLAGSEGERSREITRLNESLTPALGHWQPIAKGNMESTTISSLVGHGELCAQEINEKNNREDKFHPK